MVVSAAAALTSSVRVSGGLPLCGPAFAQVTAHRQGAKVGVLLPAAQAQQEMAAPRRDEPPQRGAYSQGCLRSKNSGSPMLSCCISSICAFSSGGGSLRSPSRASASEVKYIVMV